MHLLGNKDQLFIMYFYINIHFTLLFDRKSDQMLQESLILVHRLVQYFYGKCTYGWYLPTYVLLISILGSHRDENLPISPSKQKHMTIFAGCYFGKAMLFLLFDPRKR